MSAPPRATVYKQLVAELATGELAPGDALVETVLASRLGVSRTPIREALRRLEQDGLVERHDRGLRVRVRSPEELLEIYEVRVPLEALAAEGAARRHTEIDLVRLRAAHEAMEAMTDDDPGVQVAVNRAFHQAMWRASHNATLVDQLLWLTNKVHRYSSTTLRHPGRWQQAISEHAELVAAIEARDAERAAEIAKAHIVMARDIRLAMVASEA